MTPIDRYTKFILTIIAVALVVIASRLLRGFRSSRRGGSGTGLRFRLAASVLRRGLGAGWDYSGGK